MHCGSSVKRNVSEVLSTERIFHGEVDSFWHRYSWSHRKVFVIDKNTISSSEQDFESYRNLILTHRTIISINYLDPIVKKLKSIGILLSLSLKETRTSGRRRVSVTKDGFTMTYRNTDDERRGHGPRHLRRRHFMTETRKDSTTSPTHTIIPF